MDFIKAKEILGRHLEGSGLHADLEIVNDEGTKFLKASVRFTHFNFENQEIDLMVFLFDDILTVDFDFYKVDNPENALQIINEINSGMDAIKMYLDDDTTVVLTFSYMFPTLETITQSIDHAFSYLEDEDLLDALDALSEYYI